MNPSRSLLVDRARPHAARLAAITTGLTLLAMLGGCLDLWPADEQQLTDEELARQLATAGPALLKASYEVLDGNRALQRLNDAGSALVSAADIATSVENVTFVRAPSTAPYQPDALRKPVPASGARFVLYDLVSGAENGTADLRIPTNTASVVEATSQGQSLAYSVTKLEAGVTRPIVDVYGVDRFAGDRKVVLQGSASSGALFADFEYADSVTVRYFAGEPEAASITRSLTTQVKGMGLVETRMEVLVSVRFLDSDNRATVFFQMPAGPLSGISVQAVLSGVRGSWQITRLEVSGDATLLNPDSCPIGPNTGKPCIRYRDDSIPPETFEQLRQALLEAPWKTRSSAGGLLVPALFAIRWQQRQP